MEIFLLASQMVETYSPRDQNTPATTVVVAECNKTAGKGPIINLLRLFDDSQADLGQTLPTSSLRVASKLLVPVPHPDKDIPPLKRGPSHALDASLQGISGLEVSGPSGGIFAIKLDQNSLQGSQEDLSTLMTSTQDLVKRTESALTLVTQGVNSDGEHVPLNCLIPDA